jgi:hypothetical protein
MIRHSLVMTKRLCDEKMYKCRDESLEICVNIRGGNSMLVI